MLVRVLVLPRHGPLELPEKSPVPSSEAPAWPAASLSAAEADLGALPAARTQVSSHVDLADRKMAALQQWQTVGREMVSVAQRHLAAVKTHVSARPTWSGAGKATARAAVLTLPPISRRFERDLFEVSVENILPQLAQNIARLRKEEVGEASGAAAGGQADAQGQGGSYEPHDGAEEDEDEEEDEEEDEDEEEEEGLSEEEEEEDAGSVASRAAPTSASKGRGRGDVEIAGLLRISSTPKRAKMPVKPSPSLKEGYAGFWAFRRSRQAAKAAREAAKAAEERAKEAAEEASKGGADKARPTRGPKRKRETERTESDVRSAVAKARREVHARVKAEWNALEDGARREWALKEGQMVAAFEEASASGTGLAATSYKLKVRDGSVAQRLMRLPEEGFRAFSYVGVFGHREQKASVRDMSLEYDVQQERLTLKQCTVTF